MPNTHFQLGEYDMASKDRAHLAIQRKREFTRAVEKELGLFVHSLMALSQGHTPDLLALSQSLGMQAGYDAETNAVVIGLQVELKHVQQLAANVLPLKSVAAVAQPSSGLD
jgi:hypothetical protein